jgi:hypothetical protein
MFNDKAIQITKAVFGTGTKDEEKLGKGVFRQFGKGQEGFHISSCQFAIHYFFESMDTFQGFLRNITECTKLGGYFIGTCYDGKLVFNLLKNKLAGESIQIVENGKKIWEITKGYERNILEDNSNCIGLKIDVFQESINQTISEYLVNFDYLNRIMEDYGFKIIDNVEAKNLGLPEGSGLFSELYMIMMEDIKRNKYKFRENNEYGEAANMNAFEKKISFLNRYFIYKKIRNVNSEKIEIDLEDETDYEKKVDKKETNISVKKMKKDEKKLSPKIKKINKKIVLVPATEVVSVPEQEKEEEQEITLEKENIIEKIPVLKKKPTLIIEEEENPFVSLPIKEPVIQETIIIQHENEQIIEKKTRKPRKDIGVKREKMKKPIIKIEE